MNITAQRALDRYAGSLVCFVLSCCHKLMCWFSGPARSSSPQRILVILLSEMGSLVLAHPMFVRIRKNYPEADLFLLQFKKNTELTRLLDLVAPDHVLTIDDRSLLRFVHDALKTIRRMRSQQIDTVIDCELFSRISSIFSMLSGATIRVGFHPHTQEGLYRGSFINQPVMYNPYRHIARQFLLLADAIGSTAVPPSKSLPVEERLTVPPVAVASTEVNRMARRLAACNGWKHAFSPDILIYPGGGILPIRAWPADHYHALCRRLINDGYTVGIIGTTDDRGLAQCILHGLAQGRCLDLTGFTQTLRELIVLFHMARLLITNDGGPGQFAALSPIPVIVFFGPETPVLYGPIGNGTTILYAHAACSPCLTAYNHRNSPCDGDNQCLKSIDVAHVHGLAIDVMGHQPVSGIENKKTAVCIKGK